MSSLGSAGLAFALVTPLQAQQIEDPNSVRLAVMPTARTLEQGSGFFAGTLFYAFPVAAMGGGLHDRVTVVAGAWLVPGLQPIVHVSPKVGIVQNEHVSAAAGALYLVEPGAPGSLARAWYGAVTTGSRDHSLTVLLGKADWGGNPARAWSAVVGGETRLGPRLKLVGETWAVSGLGVTPLFVSVRFFDAPTVVDVGVFRVMEAGSQGVPVLPWVTVTYNW